MAKGGQAHHTHRVGVVEHDGIGAEIFGITQDLEEYRNGAQTFEKAAGADGVANALVDAVAGGNFIVETDAGKAGNLDAADHVIAAFENFAAIRICPYFPLFILAAFTQQTLNQFFDPAEAVAVNIDQADFPAFVSRCGNQVVDQARGKHAASPEESQANWPIKFTGQSGVCGISGVFLVTSGFLGGRDVLFHSNNPPFYAVVWIRSMPACVPRSV